ncbi:MAG: RNA polymerase sigma-70 factor [Zunongwangia sp.]|uniref:RNA polymerase sigma-70 factor n=1 Tax=Zunongwangia sp. TaxID=1965325 RepID=UPI003241F504
MTTFENKYNLFLQSLIQGEESAYASLVEKYHQNLCAYAISLTHDKDTAEDVVQNVFIRIWKKRKSLDKIKNFDGYLYQSVHNEFIDFLRKEKTLLTHQGNYIESLNRLTQEEDFDLVHLTKMISKEINNLPDRCKEIFLLSRKEGLMNKEIAEYLDISIKTVEFNISKAFKTLREKLGKDLHTLLFLVFRRFHKGSYDQILALPIKKAN